MRYRFLIGFVLLLNVANSQEDKYPHKLQGVLEEGSFVKLDDGAVWRVRNELLMDNNSHVQTWQEGDELEMIVDWQSRDLRRKLYWFKNLRTGTSIRVSDWLEKLPDMSTLRTIKDIDEKGSYLILDDGSYWKVSWSESWVSYLWKKDEHLMVYKPNRSFSSKYYLINVDVMPGQNHIEAILEE